MILGSWQLKCEGEGAAAGRLAVVAIVVVTSLGRIATAGREEPRQPINAFCPVMTEEPVNPEFTTIYESKIIGFCCDKCLAKFEANPGRYAARVTQLQEKRQPIDADHSQHKSAETHPSDRKTHGKVGARTTAERSAHDSGEEARDLDHLEHDDAAGTDRNRAHEHGRTHGAGFCARLIGWIGKFHPATVNFPIAMILGSALAELLLIATGRLLFVNAGRFCLWVGCLGAVAAAVLGWFFGGFHLVDDSWILTMHRWLGTTTAAWSVLLLILGERTFRCADATRMRYRVMLFLGAGLVGATGFFGGSLLYGLNHYTW